MARSAIYRRQPKPRPVFIMRGGSPREVLVPNLLIGNAYVPETPFRKRWVEAKRLVVRRHSFREARFPNQRFADKCVPNPEIGNERA